MSYLEDTEKVSKFKTSQDVIGKSFPESLDNFDFEKSEPVHRRMRAFKISCCVCCLLFTIVILCISIPLFVYMGRQNYCRDAIVTHMQSVCQCELPEVKFDVQTGQGNLSQLLREKCHGYELDDGVFMNKTLYEHIMNEAQNITDKSKVFEMINTLIDDSKIHIDVDDIQMFRLQSKVMIMMSGDISNSTNIFGYWMKAVEAQNYLELNRWRSWSEAERWLYEHLVKGKENLKRTNEQYSFVGNEDNVFKDEDMYWLIRTNTGCSIASRKRTKCDAKGLKKDLDEVVKRVKRC